MQISPPGAGHEQDNQGSHPDHSHMAAAPGEADTVTGATSKPFLSGRLMAGICAALILACAAIYGQTLSHGFLIYDDPLYVTDNPMVQDGLSWTGFVWSFTTARAMYMHPITWISHMADCELYALRPWGHHLGNLIFHTIDSLLLFLVFARMTRRIWPSAAVAALFAVHPLHVESVAWISERKDVLSMLFWTGGLGAYAWYRQRPQLARYLAVVFLFLCGLFSKPMVVTFPFVLLLLDYWPLGQVNRAASFRAIAGTMARLALEKTPLFLMTALFCVITFVMQAQADNLSFGDHVPYVARCANAVVVYVLYLVKTLWPSGLAAYYPHPIMRPLWQVAGAFLILVAITWFSLRQARQRPYLLVGWCWYLGTLAPVMELVQAGTFSHADRYTYIPLIGVFIMIAWGVADLAAGMQLSRRAVAIPTGVVLVTLTVCAGVQASHWRDSKTLFRHAIDVGRESSPAFNNLGAIAIKEKHFDEARAYLKKALELNPDFADALGNLGKLALEEGRFDEARMHLTRALVLKPKYIAALNNMGVLATSQRRYDEAKDCLTKALELKPDHFDVLNNLGRLALEQGRYDEAKTYLMKALKQKPENASVLNNLGWCLMNQTQYDEAQRYFRKSLEADPQFINAINNLAMVLTMSGRQEEADIYFKKALELNQGSAVKETGK